MAVVMGTAGHIDHGKTSLIEALTGTNCDQLDEEKRRGITITLGFAQLKLPGGRFLSVVDVPGHEKFVRTMVSGATGVDFVLLVIAADEGVMPQTREHLEICLLLGIRTVVVAMTKIDAADADMIELAKADITSFLEENGLKDAPVIPVSSHTREGLDVLLGALAEIEATLAPVRLQSLFRLPVDRVFTMRGSGTVVTGTLIGGSVSVGDMAQLYPDGRTSKVRNLHCHGEQTKTALAGRRVAMNLPDLAVEDIRKGDVVSYPEALFPSMRWIIYLTCLSSAPRALRHRAECHFHHGAREMQVRLYLADRDRLQPGESCLCEVRFTEPAVAVFGDRCVLRSFSPLRTVAGGVVLNSCGVDMRRRSLGFAERCRMLACINPDAPIRALEEERIVNQLAGTIGADQGLSFEKLRVLTNLDSSALEKHLSVLSSKRQVACFDKALRLYIADKPLDSLVSSCAAAVADFHKRHNTLQGIRRSELLSGWGKGVSPKLVNFVIERMLQQGGLVAENDLLRLPDHTASFSVKDAQLSESLLNAYKESGLTPPNMEVLLAKLGVDKKRALAVYAALRAAGRLVRVSEDLWYAAEHLKTIETTILRWFDDHEFLNIADIKAVFGFTRKHMVPLLEYFDAQKLTIRVGDARILRKK
ncbi:MAG: selenocysteine-specific translation elongation factor [Deltaproteobacteria bacterium]|jgi:selenocysteine-specific elongation factor|nr:selenocysteine-specific translation elongation factor [Deltaproteobacteria bacterium]